MSMLDSFFNKGFKAAKCKTLLKLTTPRIKLLRNRREIQIKQMRRDIAKLLETGQEATARIRVEHIIREENMMAAHEILELFCELITVRLPIIESQRECPIDLKEAISSVCFAAPRCADLPELLQVQMLFAAKYGKEFVAAAIELIPDCGVNRQLIELPSLLKEIAEEHGLDWDPAASEAEIYKPHEDLLSGPTQFVSGSKLPLPQEKHDETLQYAPDQAQEELSDSDDGLDSLDFPEVPKQSLGPSTNPALAPMMPPPLPTHPHPEIDQDLAKKIWVQPYHRSSRLGRSASSVFFSSGAFVFALIVIALQKFEKSNPSTPRQWYDQYPDRSRTVDNQSSGATSTMDRGVRTSSSYPDLRQQEPSWNVVRDERWRSHDDTHVAGYRIPGSDPQHQLHRRHRSWHEEPAEVVAQEEPAEVLAQEEPAEVLAQEELAEVQARVGCVLRTKNIPVNTFVIPAEQVSSSHAQIQVIQSYSPPPSPPRTKSPPSPCDSNWSRARC
ncbi:hypothetical protein DVH24_036047 [Malus domestica]|uniref:IST1-like protein n=1 Tax=Malus domestica TaxID=3750 RepID=A0A498JN47_MALDO|nr:hypothetical protein DVH24_036047 [Malus domestica]